MRRSNRFSSVASLLAISSGVALLAGCTSTPSATDTPGVAVAAGAPAQVAVRGSGATIAPGEVLEVFVVEDEALSGRYTVRPSGHLILPGVGRVPVAGVTPASAEAAIRKALEGTQLKNATVMVERSASKKAEAAEGVTVFFSGNVMTPGRRVVSYVSGRRPTLYQGILEAGGFTRFADQGRVTLNRASGSGRAVPQTVDITAVRQGRIPDPPLEDGDIVHVKEKAFGW